MKYVTRIAKEGGVGLRGAKVKIDRQAEKARLFILGSTDGKTITLLLRAFESESTLLRTIAHERTHVMQHRIFGRKYMEDNVPAMEESAHGIENTIIDYFNRSTKTWH